jgi:membrane peptidoglycan carboxypeptidase
MGKTGTTNEFRDALFVGSTFGPEGITVAVRIGFDDNRSLGSGETGGRVALPVFREVVLRAYSEKLLGPVPRFSAEMEQHISVFLEDTDVDTAAITEAILVPAKPHRDLRLPLEVGLNIGANSHTARITPSPVSIRTFPPLR